METSLYERLGRRDGIRALVNDLVDLHLENPIVGPRFQHIDVDQLRIHACDFFCAGTGGPETYSGRDMRTAHRGMNISEQEFVAVLDDALAAMGKNQVGDRERQEVLSILYSMKDDVVRI